MEGYVGSTHNPLPIGQCFVSPILYSLNHFSTTGRCSGPAHYDVSIRQAARAAFVTSSLKIFLTQNFSAMWSHVLYIAFEGDDSAIQWCQFCVSLSGSLFNILQLFAEF